MLRALLMVLLVGAMACEDSAPARVQAAVADDDAPPQDEPPATHDEDDEPDEVAPPLGNLDSLDEGDLESACFHGSQAACDRLGH